MFANKNLSVIAYANGFTLWHYAARDKLAVVCAPDFFSAVRTIMNTGDIILINADDATAIRCVVQTAPCVTIYNLQ